MSARHSFFFLASLPLVACGGEAHEAPAPIALAQPSASAPVDALDAAPPPAAPPPTITLSIHDPAVRTALDAPDPVKIDPKLLTLSAPFRAHLSHQSADATKIYGLLGDTRNTGAGLAACEDSHCRDSAKMRKASEAADAAFAAAIASYDKRATTAIAELTAASDGPSATASVALAAALYVRTHNEIHAGIDDNDPRCEGGLERDEALHPCGDIDPRVERAFARATDLAPLTDPLALLARRGVAQTASAKTARAALEPLLAGTTGAPRIALLADLSVAYAAGRGPDYDSAVRTARELVPLLEAIESARALKDRKRRGMNAGVLSLFGTGLPEEGPPTLSVRPSTAIGAARLAFFALSRTGRDREIVDAGIDVGARFGGGGEAVNHLVADAVERSDDVGLSKAPAYLQRGIYEQLATRALYRGDLDAASKWAHRAVALGGSVRAQAVLDALGKYDALPAPDASTAADPDDLGVAVKTHADATRRFESYLRLCMEPFGGTLGEHPEFTLTVSKGDAPAARAVASTRDLPARAVDCLRAHASVALAGIPEGTAIDVSLLPPRSNDVFGAGGLGSSGGGFGGRGAGIGLGNVGTLGHGAGSDAGAADAAP